MENIPKIPPQNFHCICCNYVALYQKDYNKHLFTEKHRNNYLQQNGIMPDKQNIDYVCDKCEYVTNSKSDFPLSLCATDAGFGGSINCKFSCGLSSPFKKKKYNTIFEKEFLPESIITISKGKKKFK